MRTPMLPSDQSEEAAVKAHVGASGTILDDDAVFVGRMVVEVNGGDREA